MLKNRKKSSGITQTKLKKNSTVHLKKTQVKKQTRPQTESHLTVFQENRPASASKQTKSSFNLHFASTSELIYTPFKKHYYLPPHLNSANVYLSFYPA
jgi:hypothetical protein